MGQALIADPQLITKSVSNKENEIYKCLAHIKVGSCHRCRYLKQKDLDFACVTPGSWNANINNKIEKNKRNKDLKFWKKVLDSVKS